VIQFLKYQDPKYLTCCQVQIAQLESTLKSDLVDKKKLMEALSKERESYAKLEAEFKDIQAKYFDIKEAIEGKEEQVIVTLASEVAFLYSLLSSKSSSIHLQKSTL